MLMDTGDTTITALIKLKKRIDDFLELADKQGDVLPTE
jgi:hypothetical protein